MSHLERNNSNGVSRQYAARNTPDDPYMSDSAPPSAGRKPSSTSPGPMDRIATHLGLLWEYKWLTILAVFLGGVLAIAQVVYTQPLYRARTTIEIMGLNDRFMGVGQVDPRASDSYGVNASNIQTNLLILTSSSFKAQMHEKMQERLASGGEELAMADDESPIGKLRTMLKLTPGDSQAFREAAVLDALNTMSGNQVRSSRIVEIFCDSPSPAISADFLNVLTKEFITYNFDDRVRGPKEIGAWIGNEVDEAKQRLEAAEATLRNYARDNNLVLVQEQGSLSQDHLRQIQIDLAAAQSERIQKQSRYDMALNQPPESLPEVLADNTLAGLLGKVLDLRRELAFVNTIYTPKAEKVVRLEAQLRDAEKILETQRKQVLERIRNDYEAVKRREQLMQQRYHNQATLVSRQEDRLVEYNLLRREVESRRQQYNTLLTQRSQAALASAIPSRNIRMVDAAYPPQQPVKPRTSRTLMMGLLGGFLLANGFLLLKQKQADSRVLLPGQASELLQVRELGVIPSARPKGKASRGKAAEPPTINMPAEGSPAEQQQAAIWAQSIRMTLASILVSGGNRPEERQVVVITSPYASEGKTTVSHNMGITLAGRRSATLMVDADIRRPHLHHLLKVEQSPGLAELLESTHPLTSDEISGAIRETEIPNLFLLPAGTGSADLWLDPARLREVLNDLRDKYPHIIIDTPPLLHFADARLIAQESDGVVLVLRSNVTRRESALEAAQQLENDNIKLIGTILNDFVPKVKKVGTYGSYSYERTFTDLSR